MIIKAGVAALVLLASSCAQISVYTIISDGACDNLSPSRSAEFVAVVASVMKPRGFEESPPILGSERHVFSLASKEQRVDLSVNVSTFRIGIRDHRQFEETTLVRDIRAAVETGIEQRFQCRPTFTRTASFT
jgi:hypothetical protein